MDEKPKNHRAYVEIEAGVTYVVIDPIVDDPRLTRLRYALAHPEDGERVAAEFNERGSFTFRPV